MRTLYAALSLVYSIRIPSLYGPTKREATRHCTQRSTEIARRSHQQLVTKGQFSVKVNALDQESSTYIMGTMGWCGYWNNMQFSPKVILCIRLQSIGVLPLTKLWRVTIQNIIFEILRPHRHHKHVWGPVISSGEIFQKVLVYKSQQDAHVTEFIFVW